MATTQNNPALNAFLRIVNGDDDAGDYATVEAALIQSVTRDEASTILDWSVTENLHGYGIDSGAPLIAKLETLAERKVWSE